MPTWTLAALVLAAPALKDVPKPVPAPAGGRSSGWRPSPST